MTRFARRIPLLLAPALAATLSLSPSSRAEVPAGPNVIFIQADDLGYGEVGCYGQRKIRTPNIDRLAIDGMRFTDYYAGCTVCAPSRSVLLTGLHTGHTRVRGNSVPGVQTLRKGDVTVADVMKSAGYATAVTGKWGLGDTLPGGEAGQPQLHGFDFFFGYLNQNHAHNYYPPFLFRGDHDGIQRVDLPNQGKFEATGAGVASEKRVYSPDPILDQSIDFVRKSRSRPFFLYFSPTLPHGNNEANRALGNGAEVPDLGPYADNAWTPQAKAHAAMITYLDTQVGKLLAELDALKLRENTLVIFTSDNGPHNEDGSVPAFFQASGPFRGIKRSLYEGGIRVPMIARWPGRIQPGSATAHPAYHADLMATLGELVKQPTPSAADSISYLPTLLHYRGAQPTHRYLYWEFYEQGSRQAVRSGTWKAIRQPMLTGPIELYDLATDPGERKNIASERPEKLKELAAYLDEAHVPSPDWKIGAPQ